jgi:hypothetical protein
MHTHGHHRVKRYLLYKSYRQWFYFEYLSLIYTKLKHILWLTLTWFIRNNYIIILGDTPRIDAGIFKKNAKLGTPKWLHDNILL